MSGLNIHVVGVILMLLGLALVVLDIAWWQSWSTGPRRRTTYVDDGAQPSPAARGGVPVFAALRPPP